MSKFSRRRKIIFYRFVILALVILIVWIISPLISSGAIQMDSFEIWHRIFVTIFYGAWLSAFIDIRGGMQKWKPQKPYALPRFVYILMAILVSLGVMTGMFFFNLVFIGGLFPNLLTPNLTMLIVGIFSIFMILIPTIVYYRIFNGWYEELNR